MNSNAPSSSTTDKCSICREGEGKFVFDGKWEDGSAWSLMACNHCGTAWTLPPPYNYNYEEDFFNPGANASSIRDRRNGLPRAWRRSLGIQVKAFKEVARSSAVLDIGCGEGLLLSALEDAGIPRMGIEPSRIAVEKARTEGFDVTSGIFPEALPGRMFDGINLSHVLEHLADPELILSSIESVMPRGHVLFTQSNWKGAIPQLRGSTWYAWVPHQHFWHFTPAGLTALVERRGWKIEGLWNSSLAHARRDTIISTFIGMFAPNRLDQFHLLASVGSID